MQWKSLALAVCAAGLVGAPAWASSIVAYSGAVAGTSTCNTFGTPAAIQTYFGGTAFVVGSTGNGISDCGLSGGTSGVTQATGPVSSSQSVTANPTADVGLATGSGHATANYGSMSATAGMNVVGPNAGVGIASSVGMGVFNDTLTFSGVTSSDTVEFTFDVIGELSNPNYVLGTSGAGGPLANLQVAFGGVSDNTMSAAANAGGTAAIHGHAGTDYSGWFNGTDGPYSLSGSGNFTSNFFDLTPNLTTSFEAGLIVDGEPGSNAGTFGQFNATLVGIQVFNGEPEFNEVITGWTATSGSGAVYGPDGIESTPGSGTPEPATSLLTGGALLLAASSRMLFRKRSPGNKA